MKKLFFSIALIVTASAFAQEVPQLETYTLKNGLKIYLMQYGKIPAVNIKFVISTGEKNETPGQQGYCGLTARLLLEGNTKYTQEAQNDMAFKLGGDLKSGSDFDHTVIAANFLSKDIDPAMDLFSSAILHPTFSKEKLDQDVSFMIDYNNPAKMDIANLAEVYSDLFIYGTANPLGRTYYKAQLQLITPEKIKEFHAFNYTPKNAGLIICGNFDAATVKSIVEKYFGSWTSTYGEVNGVSLDEPQIRKKEMAFINRNGATQCALRWTKTAPSRKDKDYITYKVANQIFNRILFEEIREKGGKTYSIGSGHYTSQFSNLLVTSCSVRSSEVQSTIDLFDKTLKNFSAGNITQDDFDKAVTALKVGALMSEMPEDKSDFYNPILFDYNKRKNFFNDLAALKLEDVQKVIRKYYTTDVYKLVVSGDESSVSTQLINLKGLIKYKPADIEKDN